MRTCPKCGYTPPRDGSDRDVDVDLRALAKAFFENLQIDNCEYGGIGLDSKRPFGNSSVCRDMLEIIGWEPDGDEYAEYQEEYVDTLYKEKLIPWLRQHWEVGNRQES